MNPENVTFFDSFGIEHIPENSLKIKILQQYINSGLQFYCKEKNKKHHHFWKIIGS